jgi:hypothetical protein
MKSKSSVELVGAMFFERMLGQDIGTTPLRKARINKEIARARVSFPFPTSSHCSSRSTRISATLSFT